MFFIIGLDITETIKYFYTFTVRLIKLTIMRYIISLLVLCSVAVSGVQAQQTAGAPDDDAILQEIINSDSPYNYTALFTRYMAGDTTLTPKEYHYLYYGYAWQPT